MFAVKVYGAVRQFVFTDGNVRAIEEKICRSALPATRRRPARWAEGAEWWLVNMLDPRSNSSWRRLPTSGLRYRRAGGGALRTMRPNRAFAKNELGVI